MKNEIAACLDRGEARQSSAQSWTTWPAPQKTRLAMTDHLTLPLPSGERIKVRGFTLIEVVLAIVVITIAVSATLVVMSKMMGYTISKGQAVDISNAVTISQMAIDRVRDQKFPPTNSPGDLASKDTDITLSNTNYTCHTDIVASNNTGSDSPISNIFEYPDTATRSDSMLGYRNLLKVTVTVSKNGRPLLKTVTYKTRNGYY